LKFEIRNFFILPILSILVNYSYIGIKTLLMSKQNIGKPVPRKEGRAKVTGAARYVDDLDAPGMLYGATVRSQVPRGLVREIVFGEGIPWDEFTIVTARDIPGANAVALILDDQPYLADRIVNHPEEPVLLLAHEDKYLLEEARRAVRICVEPLPAVFTIEDSLAKKEIVWGEDNVFKSFLVEKGNVDEVWDAPDIITVEGEYETGAQEQLYIEPNGVIATASAEEGVTVRGSMQCPYYVHKALLKLFDLPEDRVRVIQTETGGGFGGKEEYPSMIAGHAALLAWKSGRPVKIIYDRAEDMTATTKRHPSRTRHRTAVTRDGKLLGMEIDFVIDGGAYATLSAVVLSRGTIHAAGPYECPNVRIRSKAVATNAPPHGAFRGFGAPQSIFALERHLNKVAAAVGLAPEELRRRNFIKKDETTATGQVIREDVNLCALVDRAFELSDYHAKRERFARENEKSRIKRGIGFASFMHGAGFTGSGEKYLQSVVGCEATEEGRVRVLAASTEIGQGTNTIFAQIAADALGLDYERVEVVQPDTGNVPNSGPTVASRTCMIVGKLVESAALQLKETLVAAGLLQESYTAEDFTRACRAYIETHGALKSFSQYKQPEGIEWDDEHYRGDAYGAYAWAVYVAEVSVDTLTHEARVEDFVAVQEVGRVIHPVLAAGQIEGGVAQGIGWALYENVVWGGGRMLNGQMTNYIIPTSADIPPIRVHFFENPYAGGPAGAKGIGELPMDGPAPAILNAVEHATGVAFDRVPLMPEAIMEALEREAVEA
jgi:CO/xanthine dehydrogenase Mo-binding subunit